MLKGLRIKFIVLNMVLAACVLVVAFSAVCYIDYQARVRDVFEALTVTLNQAQSPTINQIEKLLPLVRNGEGNPDSADIAAAAAAVEAADAQAQAQQAQSGESSRDQMPIITEDTSSGTGSVQIGGGDETITPVAIYLVKDDGVYTALGNYASASISHSMLLEANEEALEADQTAGELKDLGLFYEKRNTSNGTMIAYADVSNANSWHQLAWTLVGVGTLTLVAFLLINIFFSWWALKPVEYAWKQQTQFVADASHELKTPLTVILANMAILRSQPEQTVAEQAQWVDSTQTEAERMQGLVNDMLDLARPKNATQSEFTSADVDFTDLVEAEVLQFESVAFERGIIIDTQLEQGLHVWGNQERIQRMVSTLIDNACKYANDDGTVNVTLKATAGTSGKRALLAIRNSGTIIAPEDLPHVFDRFYRADKARTSSTGGYGLGLAIAREIAREHNGDITVASSEDSGTEFTVKLSLVD